MIIDRIENMPLYVKAVPELQRIYEIMMSGTLNDAPDGAYPVGENDVTCALSTVTTHAKGKPNYEVHRYHADVQIVLQGEEVMDIADASTLKEKAPYKDDIQFFDGVLSTSYRATKETFVVFFPGEAHEPCLNSTGVATIRKAVFKLKRA